MSTPAQIAANQANAQHSTGAKTEEGIAASCKNNIRHCLTMVGGEFKIPDREDRARFEELLCGLREEHQPATITENIFVDRLARHFWLGKRALDLQETCFDRETGQLVDEKPFTLYLRYQTTHERAFHKVLTDLLKLRAESNKAKIGFESQKRKAEKHKADQFLRQARLEFQTLQNLDKELSLDQPSPAEMAEAHRYRAEVHAKARAAEGKKAA